MLNKNKVISKLIGLIILLVIYYFLNLIFNFSIPCLFNKITHLYCPGCGITRMLFSFFKLDFYQAFRYNPLVFLLLVFYILISIYNLIFTKKIKFTERFNYLLLFIVILYGILRNIPGFEYLIPTIV